MVNMSLTGHAGKVTGVEAFPSDPMQAASCGSDRCIKFWNLDRGICSKTIPFTSTAKRLKVLNDQGVVASAHFDGRLRIWDKRATSIAHEVDAHAGKDICGIDYLSQSHLICTVGRNNSIVMIDTRTFSVLGQCTHPQFSADILCQPSISPSGTFVSGGCKDGSIFIWRIDLQKRSSRVESILKSHDASVMVTCWNQSSSQGGFVSADRNGTLLFWT
jgi:autophagy-related protein 16